MNVELLDVLESIQQRFYVRRVGINQSNAGHNMLRICPVYARPRFVGIPISIEIKAVWAKKYALMLGLMLSGYHTHRDNPNALGPGGDIQVTLEVYGNPRGRPNQPSEFGYV